MVMSDAGGQERLAAQHISHPTTQERTLWPALWSSALPIGAYPVDAVLVQRERRSLLSGQSCARGWVSQKAAA